MKKNEKRVEWERWKDGKMERWKDGKDGESGER
jgi:hypothetical protein